MPPPTPEQQNLVQLEDPRKVEFKPEAVVVARVALAVASTQAQPTVLAALVDLVSQEASLGKVESLLLVVVVATGPPVVRKMVDPESVGAVATTPPRDVFQLKVKTAPVPEEVVPEAALSAEMAGREL